MNAFLQSLYSKFSGSVIESDLGGRIYLDQADSADTPYMVYSIVSGVPDNAFAKTGETVLMQFDLFSPRSSGTAAMTTLYADLTALLDDCSLTITGKKCVQFQRQNLTTMIEDRSPLKDGSVMLLHWSVDYEIVYQTA
jgi:hypothetical protein